MTTDCYSAEWLRYEVRETRMNTGIFKIHLMKSRFFINTLQKRIKKFVEEVQYV